MPTIENIADRNVDDKLDRELRTLLTTCFTKPQDVVFREHRHFREPPFHRWMIRNSSGTLVAHITVHDKRIEAGKKSFRIGGIAEVCVHPDHRGKGYVKAILTEVHKWLSANGYDFAMLFGDPKIYGSSGYVAVDNVLNDHAEADGKITRNRVTAMVRQIGKTGWPKTDVYLPGMKF